MSAPSDRPTALPKTWLILLFFSYALFSFILVKFASAPSFLLLPLGLIAAFYGTNAKPKRSFILMSFWWLILILAVADTCITMYYLQQTGSSIINEWLGINQIIKVIAILVFSKLGGVVCVAVTRPWRQQEGNYKKILAIAPLFATIIIFTALYLYWGINITIKEQKVLIFGGFLAYVIAQVVVAAAFVVPSAIAGAKLKQSFTNFHTFLILAATCGLGLGLGYWTALR